MSDFELTHIDAELQAPMKGLCRTRNGDQTTGVWEGWNGSANTETSEIFVAATLSRTLRSSPYWSTLSHKTMRHVLPGFLVSSLGDGMSVVAVGWLAIELAPSGHRGLWVAIAAAAYTLPGALGVLLLGRFLRHRGPAQLVCWDAVLRACALGAIPTVYVFGLLSIELYVALLAASSVLHSWGEAGLYTLVARVLPEHDHLAGNALLSTIGSFTTVVGPALAGPLIAWSGAATVLAVDAATFVVLAVTFQSMVPTTVAAEKDTAEDEVSSASGFNVIRRNRTLLGLCRRTSTDRLTYLPPCTAPSVLALSSEGCWLGI